MKPFSKLHRRLVALLFVGLWCMQSYGMFIIHVALSVTGRLYMYSVVVALPRHFLYYFSLFIKYLIILVAFMDNFH